MVADTESELSKSGLDQNLSSQSRFRHISSGVNGKIAKQEAIELGYRMILAEREELVEYVKALKSLAIYLTARTNIDAESLSDEYFVKAELNFPKYLRKEIHIDLE